MFVVLVSEIARSTKSMWYLVLSLITMQLIMLENVDAIEKLCYVTLKTASDVCAKWRRLKVYKL